MSDVTHDHLAHLRAVGVRVPAEATEDVTDAELVEALLEILGAPTARLAEAACHVLVELAERAALDLVSAEDLPDEVRRRLGYLAARTSNAARLGRHVGERLSEFARRLSTPDDRTRSGLAVISNPSDAYLELERERGDAVNEQWRVYGDVSLE